MAFLASTALGAATLSWAGGSARSAAPADRPAPARTTPVPLDEARSPRLLSPVDVVGVGDAGAAGARLGPRRTDPGRRRRPGDHLARAPEARAARPAKDPRRRPRSG